MLVHSWLLKNFTDFCDAHHCYHAETFPLKTTKFGTMGQLINSRGFFITHLKFTVFTIYMFKLFHPTVLNLCWQIWHNGHLLQGVEFCVRLSFSNMMWGWCCEGAPKRNISLVIVTMWPKANLLRLTYLLTYFLTYLLTYLHTYLLTYLLSSGPWTVVVRCRLYHSQVESVSCLDMPTNPLYSVS